GEFTGVRSARKHIGWYVKCLPGGESFRARMNLVENSASQWQCVATFFDELADSMDRIPAMASQNNNEEEAVEEGA
ncbi:MAG: tRNA dihydrouridine synthase DusB, partial [Ramlibacter sp.]